MTQKTDGVITHLEPDILECTVKWACPQFVVINTVKGFRVVIESEVDFFWNSLAFSVILLMLMVVECYYE